MTCTQIVLIKYQKYPFSIELVGIFNTLCDASNYTRNLSGISLSDQLVSDPVCGECYVTRIPESDINWVAYEQPYPSDRNYVEIVVDSQCSMESPWNCLCEFCQDVITSKVTEQEEWLEFSGEDLTSIELSEIIREKMSSYHYAKTERELTVILAEIYCLVKNHIAFMYDNRFQKLIKELDTIFYNAALSEYTPINMLGYFYNKKYDNIYMLSKVVSV